MWWRDAGKGLHGRARRPAGPAALVVAVCLLLAGCGFKPLYSKTGLDPQIMEELGSVEVLPLPDRQGQLIHNALLTDFNPKGVPAKPRYRLSVNVGVTETQQALRTDDTATRNVMTFSTSYWLYDGGTRVLNGSFSQIFSYDFLEEHYANVSAADDIKKRAAQSIADEIRNRVAAYFAKAVEVKSAGAHP